MTDKRPKPLRRILVVDPDTESRTAMGEILTCAGYEVTYRNEGKEVVQLHERQPFNIVIMELFMPGTDGLEVLLALHGKPAAPAFILLSRKSRVPAEVFLRLTQYLGARYFLPKPFQPEQLLSAVQQALNEA
jgi:CheY-like chemotaxis protein